MDLHMGRAAPRSNDEGTALFACKRSVGCLEEVGADLDPFGVWPVRVPSGVRQGG